MPQDARIGDIGVGVCCCHSSPICVSMSGPLITGLYTVRSNGSPTSRLGDIVLGHCGHIGLMITASSNVRAGGINSSRLTDAFTGCFSGMIVTGAPTVRKGG